MVTVKPSWPALLAQSGLTSSTDAMKTPAAVAGPNTANKRRASQARVYVDGERLQPVKPRKKQSKSMKNILLVHSDQESIEKNSQVADLLFKKGIKSSEAGSVQFPALIAVAKKLASSDGLVGRRKVIHYEHGPHALDDPDYRVYETNDIDPHLKLQDFDESRDKHYVCAGSVGANY